jgi:kynurenine formamidase
MKDLKTLAVAGAVGASLAMTGGAAFAVNDEPLTDHWAPSEFGAGDMAGAVNRTTPAMVLKAAGLVKKGKVATLGKVYQSDAPAFGVRSWTMVIPGLPTGGPFGDIGLVYNDEFLSTEIGQIGTQFDGPGHIGVRTSKGDFFYNGHMLSDSDIGTYGLGPLGVEHVAQIGFVCRGVLLDATLLHGGQLPIPKVEKGGKDPGVVTAADVKKIVEMEGLDPIGEGDCVFLYTGHGDIWSPTDWDSYDAAEKKKRVEQFNSGEPGYGGSACEYMAAQKIILWGSDTWASEAVAPDFTGETKEVLPCHVRMMPKHGIWNLENMDFHQLLADKAYEFLFAWSPLKMKGATGSPGNPIAIY